MKQVDSLKWDVEESLKPISVDLKIKCYYYKAWQSVYSKDDCINIYFISHEFLIVTLILESGWTCVTALINRSDGRVAVRLPIITGNKRWVTKHPSTTMESHSIAHSPHIKCVTWIIIIQSLWFVVKLVLDHH